MNVFCATAITNSTRYFQHTVTLTPAEQIWLPEGTVGTWIFLSLWTSNGNFVPLRIATRIFLFFVPGFLSFLFCFDYNLFVLTSCPFYSVF